MPGRISFKQLRYLVELADKRHFRKAAETAGVTQPSLSQQISLLEDLLRLRLVERGKGPVTLTAPGREIVARARRIVDDVNGLEDLATTLRSGVGGTLRLGSSLTVGPYLLPATLRHLHRDHPALSLYTREGTPSDLEQELLAGTHDTVLTQLPLQSGELDNAPLFREPLWLVLSDRHPLARKDSIALADLGGHSVLTLGPEYALSAQVTSICRNAGAAVLDRYRGTSLDGLRLMAGMEMGLAIMPGLYVRSEVVGRDPSVVAIPFRNRAIHRTIGLAWRKTSGRLGAIDLLLGGIRASIASDFGAVVTGLH
jgi:LysR family hydrogen peroxide-inducible transcriptional activator